MHEGFGQGKLSDGDITFTIDGEEVDLDGVFRLKEGQSYDVHLKRKNGSFLGFLILLGRTSTLPDSSSALSFNGTTFPLATQRRGICPPTTGFVCHSNPSREPITEINATLKFDEDSGAIGDLITLDVNVVVSFNDWYYSGYNLNVSKAPIAFTPCFSGDTLVEIAGQEEGQDLPMKNLQIGDLVKVAKDKYEPVYSFGHYNPSAAADFIVVNNKLELSPNHLIAVRHQGTSDAHFVPASSVQVGDVLVDGEDKDVAITSIASKSARGVFAPFTPSGTIMVNGFLASSFVALDEDEEEFSTLTTTMIGGVGLSHHWLAHAFEFPHRLICYYLGRCPNEQYTSDGISTWVDTPRTFFQWLLQKQEDTIVMALIMIPVLLLFGLMTVVEAVVFGAGPWYQQDQLLLWMAIGGFSVATIYYFYVNYGAGNTNTKKEKSI